MRGHKSMTCILSVLSFPLTYIINFPKNEDFSTQIQPQKCNLAKKQAIIQFPV